MKFSRDHTDDDWMFSTFHIFLSSFQLTDDHQRMLHIIIGFFLWNFMVEKCWGRKSTLISFIYDIHSQIADWIVPSTTLNFQPIYKRMKWFSLIHISFFADGKSKVNLSSRLSWKLRRKENWFHSWYHYQKFEENYFYDDDDWNQNNLLHAHRENDRNYIFKVLKWNFN